MSDIVLLDELPPDGRERYPEFWAALRNNPGKWAAFPGKSRQAKPGFERAFRDNKIFYRFVGDSPGGAS